MNFNLIQSSSCPHTVIFDCICAQCGTFVTPDERYRKNQDIYVLTTAIKTSAIEIFLHDRKKLALIVDLDKTLIDTIRFLNEQQAQTILSLDKSNKS